MIRPRYIAAACSLLLAPAAFVGVFTLMLVLGTPPSCQDGPCAWDEELDGPAPLVAQEWLVFG
jgi:hypothetical protein